MNMWRKQLISYMFLNGMAFVMGSYPATYPFENEDIVPPPLPAATPTWKFIEDDPGGYQYTYSQELVLTDELWDEKEGYSAFCFTEMNIAPAVVLTWGQQSSLGRFPWNCTAGEMTYSMFTGIINNEKICEVGSCCQQYYGLQRFANDQDIWHTWTQDYTKLSYCEGDLDEVLYCLYTNGHNQVDCFYHILSPDTRVLTHNCYDYSYRYWTTCKLILVDGFNTGMDLDTVEYMSKLTVSENIAHGSLWYTPDKICKPHSYFHSSESGSSSTASSLPEDVSGSRYAQGLLMATGLLLSFFI